MQGFRAITALAVTVAALAGTSTADAHRHGCHRWHVCPSDHHTYVWRGLSCAAPHSRKLDRARDRTRVRFGGRLYFCHRVR